MVHAVLSAAAHVLIKIAKFEADAERAFLAIAANRRFWMKLLSCLSAVCLRLMRALPDLGQTSALTACSEIE